MIVSSEAHQLASFIFEQNSKDSNILLTMQGLSDSYELFSFCVFLIMQGVIYICGGTSIDIEQIDPVSLKTIQSKMYCVGINCQIKAEAKLAAESCVQVRSKPDPKDLTDYALFLHSKHTTFVISFSLVRQNLIKTCHQLKM